MYMACMLVHACAHECECTGGYLTYIILSPWNFLLREAGITSHSIKTV